jgi:hypothetical protein
LTKETQAKIGVCVLVLVSVIIYNRRNHLDFFLSRKQSVHKNYTRKVIFFFKTNTSNDSKMTMQFSYNSDHPGIDSITGVPYENIISYYPEEFPPVEPLSCAKITTRIYHPIRNEVLTVKDVLVRTAIQPISNMNQLQQQQQTSNNTTNRRPLQDSDDASMMSSSSSSSSSFSDVDDDDDNNNNGGGGGGMNNSLDEGGIDDPNYVDEYAYWTQRTIREAIYGRVMFAIILRKRRKFENIPLHQQQQQQSSNTTSATVTAIPDWIVTDQSCAIKEMSWQHMRKERSRLAEDPIKEVAAMQYFKSFYKIQKERIQQQSATITTLSNGTTTTTTTIPQHINSNVTTTTNTTTTTINNNPIIDSFYMMNETNVMIPLDLLTDERYLYSIMPFCDGGELFERLDANDSFTEVEARFWMKQILNVRFILFYF